MEGPRRPRPSEVDDLARLLWDVFDYFREHSSVHRLRREIGRKARMRTTLVIAEDGRPVSHIRAVYDRISILGCRVKVASVGSVCTHPDYRGRGFAATLLARSLADMKAAGARIVIISGDRGLYRRAHCVPAGHLLNAHLQPDPLPAAPGGLTVRRGNPDDWPILAALHSAEPVRFLRTADRFAALCAQWVGSPPELWLVESHAEPIAYVWLGPLWSQPRAPSREVSEYAGSRAALVQAVPQLLRSAELQELDMAFLGYDRELTYLLARRGISSVPITLPGTHGLLNLPGLMCDLRPSLAARLSRADLRALSLQQHNDTCTFALGGERLELDASQATRLVLGGPDSPSLGGELGRVLARIFPMPFPLPGFNAV